jgi:HD superfamily phosphohydrolase
MAKKRPATAKRPVPAQIDDPAPGPSLGTIRDAIHGVIDVSPPFVARILRSPMIDRLRRIKQLSFASYAFVSADHTRYAHALGTMHVMKSMLEKFGFQEFVTDSLLRDLRNAFPQVFEGIKSTAQKKQLVCEHLLAAALLQDVGELPYNMASSVLLRPHQIFTKRAQECVGNSNKPWDPKDIFTLGMLADPRSKDSLQGFDVQLLAYLISGHIDRSRTETSGLLTLRQMLDGVVDADRLDYVFRDAHHTVGVRDSPGAVIGSLVRYDSSGPIFSDPGPVADFLATRASLWSKVYLAPQNRFRLVLLVTVLRQAFQVFGGADIGFLGGIHINSATKDAELTPDAFLSLDDISLNSTLSLMSSDKRFLARMGDHARRALELLLGDQANYQHHWLLISEPAPLEKRYAILDSLPSDFFYDTLSDYRNHAIYSPSAIRIEADEFRFLENGVLTIESCSGALSGLFRTSVSPLPVDNSILAFFPVEGGVGKAWDDIREAVKSNGLAAELLLADPFLPAYVADTRKKKGFKKPCIFISYAVEDIDIAARLANALFAQKRCYLFYGKTYQGLGNTPARNSIMAIKEAGAVVIIASKALSVKLQKGEPRPYVAQEFSALRDRLLTEKNRIPVVAAPADDASEVTGIKWTDFGFDSAPFLGTRSLRRASEIEFREFVDELLQRLEARTI